MLLKNHVPFRKKGSDMARARWHKEGEQQKYGVEVTARRMTKLTSIKIIHTIIWFFFNGVLSYMGYAVIVNKIGFWVYAGIGIILIEGIVLLIFGKVCPVTIIARKYSDSSKEKFDIFLPAG